MPDFLAEALTWPQNYSYALAVETAYKTGIRPLTFIVKDAQPDEPWTDADKKLMLAWTILERETCSECNQPLWICRSEDNNLGFSVRKGMCYAKKEVEEWQKKPAGKNIKAGEVPYVVPVKVYDKTKSFPRRSDYFKQLEEE